MRRALFLLLVFAPLGQSNLAFGPLAWAQSLECNAQEVHFNFSATVSGSLTAPDGVSYPRAGLPGYLSFLEALPPAQLFLPTQVVGTPDAFVTCTVTTPKGGGGGGVVCGARTTRCLRLRVSGNLSPPLANSRVYVLGWVVSGDATSHVPTPTPLGSIPDNGGLFSIGRNTTATVQIWIFLEFAASDSYLGPYSGSLLFTYVLQKN